MPATVSSSSLRTPQDRLIVALDVPSLAEALSLMDRLEGQCRWVKVGLQLYLTAGPEIVNRLTARGLHVFLDLKLHDIPNTVAGAIASLADSGAALLTVHAAGGQAMLEAAAESAARHIGSPRLLAVTVLTSMDATQLHGIGVPDEPAVQVLRLAALAHAAGLDGVVCSPEEIGLVRKRFGPSPLLVIPGIRPMSADLGDQRRVATPASAIADGASMLVVGRPITQSPDPAGSVSAILEEMRTAHDSEMYGDDTTRGPSIVPSR